MQTQLDLAVLGTQTWHQGMNLEPT